MKRIRLKRPNPAMIVAIVALVGATVGTAFAGIPKGDPLKLGMFKDDSRDRLAGTGVIQYANAPFVTPTSVDSFNTVHTYAVRCELAKKATSGGFKWTGATPDAGHYQLLDAYPTGQGFIVRLQLQPDDPATPVNEGTALGKPLSVYANCVKSRAQRGTPPT